MSYGSAARFSPMPRVVLEQPFEPAHDAALRGHAEAVLGEIVEQLAVPREPRRAFRRADAVGVEREPARSR